MALRFEPDVSHADWWAGRDEPWQQLCTIGPRGFAAYVQVLHPLDDEDDRVFTLADVEGNLDDRVFTSLTEVLAEHTGTPDDCWIAWWEGDGYTDHPGLMPREALAGPRVRLPQDHPDREYLLFRGAPADAVARDVGMPARADGMGLGSPAAMWPDDHAWFMALDVDSSWTGIGGSHALADRLLGDPRFETRTVACTVDIVDPRGGPF
ncbi:hypothetical protein ACFP3Q_09940 [Nocardioides sp. GCM10027113]|uniref:hypothetical protein n=1 Tax=unclassified Nocardioides TaxID=2615069 RepID=UPI00360734D2